MILFVSTGPFTPADRGGKLRTEFFFKTMLESDDVFLLSFISSEHDYTNIDSLHEPGLNGTSTVYVQKKSTVRRMILNLFSPSSVFCEKYGMQMGMRLKLISEIRRLKPSLVFFSHFHLAPLVNAVPPGIKTIIDLQNIESFTLKSFISAGNIIRSNAAHWQAKKLLSEESRYLPCFDAVSVCSDDDKFLISDKCRSVSVIPNPAPDDFLSYIHNEPKKFDVCFSGAFNYSPNMTALRRLEKIMRSCPELSCIVVGKSPPEKISQNITVTGYVDDIRPFVSSARIFAAPVVEGGGTKIKIIHAAALKIPIITTPEGARGLHLENEKDCLIRNIEDFPAALKNLYNNETLQKTLAENAYTKISGISASHSASILKELLQTLRNMPRISHNHTA